MTVSLSTTQILAGAGVLVLLFTVWRASARKARAAADAARASARVVSLAGRVLFTGAAFVGVQWLVITHPGSPLLLLVVLAVPDLIAAHVLTRALTVTTLDAPTMRRRGGGRR
ncbi:hypothetical protein SAMN04489729_3450 [Amycolatopsis lurida]|uniref:Uncharacterized protein n=1 Tax=Amycolatopsis lurida NRRL 2430 TaxID=1460371 RepID=A0A2P2FLR9_AMYLU|nr:hypothetical protein [Amycolatopsis lurida]KFU77667.1 hypothetical protein BB31_29960 [Amycolatopsis lurida NRRL 2430]SED13045.1 hypothetical protein SAMN04489729_3450 [Amycolatopsis lurida]